ncbi:MAG: hypothetical protein JO048_03025 [Methylobacteriaceae bacterium]|nr:hypothetical protein [Methylobacteriaceae bacterium]
MAVHFFHCTDGVDLVVDRVGREVRHSHEVARQARLVADGMMAALPDYDEWQNWAVHVYDARGEVEIVPFLVESRDKLAA